LTFFCSWNSFCT